MDADWLILSFFSSDRLKAGRSGSSETVLLPFHLAPVLSLGLQVEFGSKTHHYVLFRGCILSSIGQYY